MTPSNRISLSISVLEDSKSTTQSQPRVPPSCALRLHFGPVVLVSNHRIRWPHLGTGPHGMLVVDFTKYRFKCVSSSHFEPQPQKKKKRRGDWKERKKTYKAVVSSSFLTVARHPGQTSSSCLCSQLTKKDRPNTQIPWWNLQKFFTRAISSQAISPPTPCGPARHNKPTGTVVGIVQRDKYEASRRQQEISSRRPEATWVDRKERALVFLQRG